jgi:hypothetical protein
LKTEDIQKCIFFSVLLTAPMIPAESGGMGHESTRMRQESTGMSGFRQEWNWIPQESTGMGYLEFKKKYYGLI